MTRKEFTRRTKLQAWDRTEGHCEECTVKIRPGNGPEYDHRIPCELGGDNSPENCQVLCKNCHGTKTTKKDAPAIAKSRSVRAAYVGANNPRNPLPGGRNSGIKKKLTGEVVPRS